ncbi:MAG: iron ABC transporter permease [Clostridiales bacterium]|nr:iron ABC transporter permease [Clostridiales bacterium]
MSILYYSFRNYFAKPQNVILVVLSVLLFFLTLVPLVSLINESLTVHAAEIPAVKGSQMGDFTFFHWDKVFAGKNSGNIFYKPILNSFIISFGSCATALFTGGIMAWLVTRTDMKHKGVISGLFMLPYMMPSWTLALAWRNIFRNSYAGGASGLFTAFTGVEMPNWFSYGAFPIIIALGIHYAPFAYILIGGVLRNMDSNLEEAAQLLHASRYRILTKVTFPITLPAILSTVLLVFSSSFGSYAVIVFLGSATKYQVLTTQMFSKLNGTNPGVGYVMTVVMIAIGVTILMINLLVTGTRKSYTTITGKCSNFSLLRMKKLRTLISILVLVFVLMIAVLPLISFAVESMTEISGVYSLDNFTFKFWIGAAERNANNSEAGILRNASVLNSLWNTFKVSLIVALIAGTIGILCGYATAKAKGTKMATLLTNLAFFPYLMPALAFGAIYLSMFSKQYGPIPSLYGTVWILILAGSIKYLPFASRAGYNAMMQIGNSIEEAAVIMDVPWHKRMSRIIFPIQKSSFISGYLLPFISSMREYSLYALLCVPSTKVLTTLLYAYNERSIDQYANAINLLIIIVVISVNLIINKVTGASIDKGIGG